MNNNLKYTNDSIKEYLLTIDKNIKKVYFSSIYYGDNEVNLFYMVEIKKNIFKKKKTFRQINHIKYTDIDYILRINKLKKIKQQISINKHKKQWVYLLLMTLKNIF